MNETALAQSSIKESRRTYGTIKYLNGEWVIDAEPQVMMILRRIFEGLSRFGHARISHTPSNCRDLEWFLSRYPLEVSHPDILFGMADQHRKKIFHLESILAGDYKSQVFDLAIPLRHYQQQAVDLYLANNGLLCADDLGLGKSAIGIASFLEQSTMPAVVVALTHLTYQWQDEIHKFAPDLFTHVVKKGTPYELPTHFGRQPDVLIMNYHKVAGWCDELVKWAKSIVFDECQELRREGSQKYQASKAIAMSCDYRLGTSATPIYNYGDEIFNVLDVLTPGALGRRHEFLSEWCTSWGTKYRVKDPAALGSFLRENFLMLRRTRADVQMELPPIIRIPHSIDSDTRELHRASSGARELASIILRRTESTKEERFVAGGQFDMIMRQATGLAKAPFVADFVRMLLESEKQVILAGWHREVYKIWEEKLQDMGIAYYTGTENAKQKKISKQRFLDGDARILFMSLRSGAGLEGLQTACNVIVFGELDWSYGVHEQCIGRIRRDGMSGPPTAYYLISDDGADPIMADVLGVKREQLIGINDPDAPLIEKLDRGGAHVKELAIRFLERTKGVKCLNS